MIRKSKREIERALEELDDATPTEYRGRPDELSANEKDVFDELFDVDPRDPGQSEGHALLERLHERGPGVDR